MAFFFAAAYGSLEPFPPVFWPIHGNSLQPEIQPAVKIRESAFAFTRADSDSEERSRGEDYLALRMETSVYCPSATRGTQGDDGSKQSQAPDEPSQSQIGSESGNIGKPKQMP